MQGRELWYVGGSAIAGSVATGRWILDKNTALNRRREDAAYRQLYLPDDAAHRAPPFRVKPAGRSKDDGTRGRSAVPEASSSFN